MKMRRSKVGKTSPKKLEDERLKPREPRHWTQANDPRRCEHTFPAHYVRCELAKDGHTRDECVSRIDCGGYTLLTGPGAALRGKR